MRSQATLRLRWKIENSSCQVESISPRRLPRRCPSCSEGMNLPNRYLIRRLLQRVHGDLSVASEFHPPALASLEEGVLVESAKGTVYLTRYLSKHS